MEYTHGSFVCSRGEKTFSLSNRIAECAMARGMEITSSKRITFCTRNSSAGDFLLSNRPFPSQLLNLVNKCFSTTNLIEKFQNYFLFNIADNGETMLCDMLVPKSLSKCRNFKHSKQQTNNQSSSFTWKHPHQARRLNGIFLWCLGSFGGTRVELIDDCDVDWSQAGLKWPAVCSPSGASFSLHHRLHVEQIFGNFWNDWMFMEHDGRFCKQENWYLAEWNCAGGNVTAWH